MGCRPENRIQRISLYDNIPSFFFLFAVFLFLFSTNTLAYPNENADPMGDHIRRQISSPSIIISSSSSSQRRTDGVYFYQLHNRCSKRHVSVKQRLIQARATKESPYAWLRIEPVNFGGRIRIRSNTSHYYLCFNANGSLTVKLSADGRKRCTFIEQFSEKGDFIQFQSDANPSWSIGFNKDGHRVAGNHWKKKKTTTTTTKRGTKDHMKCFQFQRTGWKKQTPNGTIDVEPPQWPDPGSHHRDGLRREAVKHLTRNDRSKREKGSPRTVVNRRKPK